MKKLIMLGLVLVLFCPAIHAKRKKEKAGDVQESTYIDKMYNFKFTLNDEDWKYKIGDNEEHFRLILTQKNPKIPTDYLDAPDYTYVPRIVVYADTSSWDVFSFLDSLISKTYSSDQKKEILKEFEIINPQAVLEGTEQDPTNTRQRLTVDIGGETGLYWEGQAQYRKYLPSPSDATKGKVVYGAYGGGITVGKKGKTIVLFCVMSEWDFFAPVMDQAMAMIKSLAWVGEEKETEDKK
jgi:hypothetical protein